MPPKAHTRGKRDTSARQKSDDINEHHFKDLLSKKRRVELRMLEPLKLIFSSKGGLARGARML